MNQPIGKINPAIRDVHIWGGGVAGLLMGHTLSQRGHHIILHEKSDRLGGKIDTASLPTGLVERGPNALYADAIVMDLLDELGLEPIPSRSRLRRLIWRDGFHSAFNPRLTARILARLPKAIKPPDMKTTMAEFLQPLLGHEGIRTLISPALQGIYGTQADQLTVGSVWPQFLKTPPERYYQLPKALRKSKARSVSFKGGMGEFIEALANSLTGEIRLNDQTPFELVPNTVICTDAVTAAQLLTPYWQEGSEWLAQIPYLPMTSVTLHYAEAFTPSDGAFGVLFPQGEGFHSLGCLFNHSIFPHRVEGRTRTSLTFILPQVVDSSALAYEDAHRLGLDAQGLGELVNPWPKALPLYGEARFRAMEALKTSDSIPAGLVLFGNYVAGISLREMVKASRTIQT